MQTRQASGQDHLDSRQAVFTLRIKRACFHTLQAKHLHGNCFCPAIGHPLASGQLSSGLAKTLESFLISQTDCSETRPFSIAVTFSQACWLPGKSESLFPSSGKLGANCCRWAPLVHSSMEAIICVLHAEICWKECRAWTRLSCDHLLPSVQLVQASTQAVLQPALWAAGG